MKTLNMSPRAVKMRESKAIAAKQAAELAISYAKTEKIVLAGKCPTCGAKLKRNYALTGWWQCEQYGAIGFRANPNLPSCTWQDFTEH